MFTKRFLSKVYLKYGAVILRGRFCVHFSSPPFCIRNPSRESLDVTALKQRSSAASSINLFPLYTESKNRKKRDRKRERENGYLYISKTFQNSYLFTSFFFSGFPKFPEEIVHFEKDELKQKTGPGSRHLFLVSFHYS